jgi:hypothetical protein
MLFGDVCPSAYRSSASYLSRAKSISRLGFPPTQPLTGPSFDLVCNTYVLYRRMEQQILRTCPCVDKDD